MLEELVPGSSIFIPAFRFNLQWIDSAYIACMSEANEKGRSVHERGMKTHVSVHQFGRSPVLLHGLILASLCFSTKATQYKTKPL